MAWSILILCHLPAIRTESSLNGMTNVRQAVCLEPNLGRHRPSSAAPVAGQSTRGLGPSISSGMVASRKPVSPCSERSPRSSRGLMCRQGSSSLKTTSITGTTRRRSGVSKHSTRKPLLDSCSSISCATEGGYCRTLRCLSQCQVMESAISEVAFSRSPALYIAASGSASRKLIRPTRPVASCRR